MIASTNTVTTVNHFNNVVSFSYFAESSTRNYGDDAYNSTLQYGEDYQKAGINQLVNSGTVVSLTLIVGAVLIITAILIRVRKRSSKSSKH